MGGCSLTLTLNVEHFGNVVPALRRAPLWDFLRGAGLGLDTWPSVTCETRKTKAQVYSVCHMPSGYLFLLWVPLSLCAQPLTSFVSWLVHQYQWVFLSNTWSNKLLSTYRWQNQDFDDGIFLGSLGLMAAMSPISVLVPDPLCSVSCETCSYWAVVMSYSCWSLGS